MTSTALGDLMLAEQVALPRPETWGDHCPAWIESAGRKCGKDRTHGYLCARHHAVALKRYQHAELKTAARQATQHAETERLRPKRLARLAWLEAEIARLDPPPPTTDPAAWGGVGMRGYKNPYTPDRIHRLAEFTTEAEQLRRLVGPRKDTP